jgi:hypothetical protein
MTELTTSQKKVLAMKALLGDEAAKKVLDAAEQREKAAQAAGVEFKEKDKPAATTKDDKKQPVKLSAILSDLEAALEAGEIEDDLENQEEAVEDQPVNQSKEAEDDILALKELIAEVVDARLEAFVEKVATKDKKTAPDPRMDKLTASLKEAQANVEKLQKELAELNGSQPKSAPYRASQAQDTVRNKEQARTEPGPDPLAGFIDGFVIGKPDQAQP